MTPGCEAAADKKALGGGFGQQPLTIVLAFCAALHPSQ